MGNKLNFTNEIRRRSHRHRCCQQIREHERGRPPCQPRVHPLLRPLLQARGDADAAVAKTAAIKNIQKALTARILKRLDDGQPLVEVARKMKAIEGMQPQINDMERRLGIMQSVEPVLENPSRPSRRSSMSEVWARNEHLHLLTPYFITDPTWS